MVVMNHTLVVKGSIVRKAIVIAINTIEWAIE
jgi:hypothetical protein